MPFSGENSEPGCGPAAPAVCETMTSAPRTHSLDTALVLFSGGQDSTVCLAWALERFGSVETVGFDYGQRHRVELEVRPRIRENIAALKPEWKARLGDDHLIRLDALGA